jgi:predicted transposase/invertase (TIGR01784 family)
LPCPAAYLKNQGACGIFIALKETMGMKLLLPTNDFVFKKIFSEKLGALEDFLKSVLDLLPDEYKELKVVNPELEQKYPHDKLGVLDVKILLKSGVVIDVEMQVQSQTAIWKRMNFYASQMVVEQLTSGVRFRVLNRAISIVIADFVMLQEDAAYHHCFRMYDEKNRVRYPESTEINTLELPKMKEPDGTALGEWLAFFKAKTEEELMNAAEKNPAIKEALEHVIYLSGDALERARAASLEKYKLDMYEFEADARQEGLQKGIQEEKLSVARTALGQNISHELIATLTGLSLADIESLAAERKH